jgi:crossover junction endodeoxyribonuclease RusA
MPCPSAYQDRHLRCEESATAGLRGSAGVDGAGEGRECPVAPLGAVTFRVEGMAPAPQGSKRHVGGGVMIESCKAVKPWRLLVAHAAIAAGVPLMRGPVRLSLVFIFTRPAGHFRKNGTLKPSAPAYHAVKPDGSKLLRSTEDALTGLAFEDDARIVGCTLDKRYAVGDERPGALITVIPLSK